MVYDFINGMINKSKYFSKVMRKHFNKELVMTKEDIENFKISTKCFICDNNYVDNDIKVKHHCHITAKYRDAANRDFNINLKLIQKSFLSKLTL